MSGRPTFGAALLRIAPADIHIPKRLGLFFPDKAEALGTLMAIHGQRTPITVRKSARGIEQPWTLIVGMHRTHGAIIKGLPEVIALERIGVSAADALDEEASENLDRRDQPPLEQAIFIHATCEAARARILAIHGTDNQRVIAGRARQASAGDKLSPAEWSKVKSGEIRAEQALQAEVDETMHLLDASYGWQDSVAAAFNRSKRDIQRALRLYRMIIEPFPDLVQQLSDHPVVGGNASQLKEIADVKDEGRRREVIEQLLGNHELGAADARTMAGVDAAPGRAPTQFEKFTNQISGGLSRLSAPDQKRALPSLVSTLKSIEVKRQLRDLLNEELGDA